MECTGTEFVILTENLGVFGLEGTPELSGSGFKVFFCFWGFFCYFFFVLFFLLKPQRLFQMKFDTETQYMRKTKAKLFRLGCQTLGYPWGSKEHCLRTTLVNQSGHFADWKESQGHKALA